MSIEEFCKTHGIYNYTVDENNFINSDYPIFLSSKNLDKLPVKFGTVRGGFWINDNNLTTLEGCPNKIINGGLSAASNNLTSLLGCPNEIEGDLYLYENELTDLENFPKKLNGGVYLRDNKLTSLKGCSKTINGDFIISENKELTSLKYGPQTIRGEYNVLSCNIRTLEHLPNNLKNDWLNIHGNPVYWVADTNKYQDILAFKDCKVITNDKVNLKRLKYYLNIVESLSDWKLEYILSNIKDIYEIV